MDILDKILKLREKRGWTEYRLAEEAKLPQSTISSWYVKDMTPSISSLEKICSAFGMTLSQFFAEGNAPVDLTEEQRKMLDEWNTLTPEQKEVVFNLLKAI
jgi:transcriptional regulator with XRE-family HTH domain